MWCATLFINEHPWDTITTIKDVAAADATLLRCYVFRHLNFVLRVSFCPFLSNIGVLIDSYFSSQRPKYFQIWSGYDHIYCYNGRCMYMSWSYKHSHVRHGYHGRTHIPGEQGGLWIVLKIIRTELSLVRGCAAHFAVFLGGTWEIITKHGKSQFVPKSAFVTSARCIAAALFYISGNYHSTALFAIIMYVVKITNNFDMCNSGIQKRKIDVIDVCLAVKNTSSKSPWHFL